jgi:putative membrane protein
MAAERTLLAWVRTGLSLMGFGFIVARFGLFLREMASLKHIDLDRSPGLSLWIGTALVLIGVVVQWACAQQHVRLMRQLGHDQLSFGRGSRLGVAVAVLLGLLGLAMAVYLVAVG